MINLSPQITAKIPIIKMSNPPMYNGISSNINQNGKTKIHPIIIPNINRREKTIKSALFIRNGGFQITGVAQTKPKEFLENAFVPLLYAVNSATLAVSRDAGGASIFSFQYKIHTHNILYTYYKVQLHAFRILQILRQIYYLCIYLKIFFVLLFPEQKNCQSSKFQAI